MTDVKPGEVAERIDVMNEDEGSLPQTEAACDALLAQFVLKADGPARKLSEAIYGMLLEDVQNYLRDNATWNLSSEIDRCRRVEAENRALKDRVKRLEEVLLGVQSCPKTACGTCNAIIKDALERK